MIRTFSLLLLAAVLLDACSGGGGGRRGLGPGEVPREVKIGKPYQVMGKTYVPTVQPDYDEIGLASWYGPGFHGKYTANGERFDSKAMTAAHPTLPLPSLVRVTDLLTGKSAVVRVNDRGPFSEKRIIDLSEAAARELGVKGRGIAKVRVQFLPEETDRYLAGISTPDRPVMYPKTDMPPVLLADAAPIQDDPGYADIRESRNVAAIAPIGAVELRELSPANGLRAPQPRAPVLAAAPLENRAGVALEGDEGIAPLPETAYERVEIAAPRTITAEPAEMRVPFGKAGLYIQAGSFSIANNAEHLATRLRGIGPAFVTRQTVQNQVWYRVRLGPIEEREQADNLLRQVNGLGFPDAKIIQD